MFGKPLFAFSIFKSYLQIRVSSLKKISKGEPVFLKLLFYLKRTKVDNRRFTNVLEENDHIKFSK